VKKPRSTSEAKKKNFSPGVITEKKKKERDIDRGTRRGDMAREKKEATKCEAQ
jgi:hypothetical protein